MLSLYVHISDNGTTLTLCAGILAPNKKREVVPLLQNQFVIFPSAVPPLLRENCQYAVTGTTLCAWTRSNGTITVLQHGC
jgi:hypothetical protein